MLFISYYECSPGVLEIISYQLSFDIQNWIDKYKKPIIVSEYGADSLPGVHCVSTNNAHTVGTCNVCVYIQSYVIDAIGFIL